jgi:hypothetical protein
MKFPKTIYANWKEPLNEEPYLRVTTKIETINEYTDKVAIYELKEIKTLKVTRELK